MALLPGVLDRQGAAEYLQISPPTLDKLLESGAIRHIYMGDPKMRRRGALLRIRVEWIIEYLEANAIGGTTLVSDSFFPPTTGHGVASPERPDSSTHVVPGLIDLLPLPIKAGRRPSPAASGQHKRGEGE